MSSEMLRFRCPNCGVRLKAYAAHAGNEQHCPKCRYTFVVPQRTPPVAGSYPRQISGVCDICNQPSSTREGGKVFTSQQIKEATNLGFNGLVGAGAAASMLNMLGMDADLKHAIWKQQVMRDVTDWFLCPQCQKRIAEYL